MNDSEHPEDAEPTSFAETAKNWYRKHKPKIRVVVGGVTLIVGLVAVSHLTAGRDAESSHDEDNADSEPVSGRETTGEPRQSPSPHLRNLHEGHNASEEKRAEYKALTGNDLAPGTTWVDGGSRQDDSREDEDPGEAAA